MEKKNVWREILITVFTFALVTVFWQTCIKREAPAGVYIIGKVIKADTLKGSHYIGLQYTFNDTTISAVFPVPQPAKVGDLYFVKVWKELPNRVQFNPQEAVPRCFDITGAPKDGWSELPSCE